MSAQLQDCRIERSALLFLFIQAKLKSNSNNLFTNEKSGGGEQNWMLHSK